MPKLVPVITTLTPGGAEFGAKPVMDGLGGLTVTVEEPHIGPVHALNVAAPAVSPNATPRSVQSLVIVATALFEELHVTDDTVCVLPSLNVPVAVKD